MSQCLCFKRPVGLTYEKRPFETNVTGADAAEMSRLNPTDTLKRFQLFLVSHHNSTEKETENEYSSALTLLTEMSQSDFYRRTSDIF